MVSEGGFNLVIGEGSGGAQFLVHGRELFGEGKTEIGPEDRLLAVEHIRAGFGLVGIFEVVGKGQGTFVVTNSVAFMTCLSAFCAQ